MPAAQLRIFVRLAAWSWMISGVISGMISGDFRYDRRFQGSWRALMISDMILGDLSSLETGMLAGMISSEFIWFSMNQIFSGGLLWRPLRGPGELLHVISERSQTGGRLDDQDDWWDRSQTAFQRKTGTAEARSRDRAPLQPWTSPPLRCQVLPGFCVRGSAVTGPWAGQSDAVEPLFVSLSSVFNGERQQLPVASPHPGSTSGAWWRQRELDFFCCYCCCRML